MSNELEIYRYSQNQQQQNNDLQHSFEDIVRTTIPKMLDDPATTNIASKYLATCECSNEDLRLYPNENIFACVGYWDYDINNISGQINRIMSHQSLDSIYAFLCTCSLISPQEHPSKFDKNETESQQDIKSTNYVKSVIDNSITSIEITDSNGKKWTADQTSLDRILLPPQVYEVSKNLWPNVSLPRDNEGVAHIRGAFDSYFAFIKFPKPDTYTINIKSESPLFDAPEGKKFIENLQYTITAIP